MRGGARPGAGRKPGKIQLSPSLIENIRRQIKTSWIIKRLEDHISGAKKMEPSAVTAALGLLKKTVPDLSAVELSGEIDSQVMVNIVKYADDQASE